MNRGIKSVLKCLATNLTTAVMTQVVYCNLFALRYVPQSVDGVPFDAFVPVFLCIVIAGVVDATGFEKNCPSGFGLNRKAIRSNNTKIHVSGVLVWIKVV